MRALIKLATMLCEDIKQDMSDKSYSPSEIVEILSAEVMRLKQYQPITLDCEVGYMPFGPEWEAELMKHKKIDLIRMLKKELMEKNERKINRRN